MYIRKAGTVILALAVVMWFLSSFPHDAQLEATYAQRIAEAQSQGTIERVDALEEQLGRDRLAASYAGSLGDALTPILRPIGLGDWKVGTALVAGFGAKEVVVSTLGTLYSLGEEAEEDALMNALRKDDLFTPLTAYTLMVFVLIYVPCLPTIVVVWRESRSIRWPLFLAGYTTALAWVVAFLVYQGGRLLQIGLA